MKKILLCALVTLLSLSLMAQDEVSQKPKSFVHYQGEVWAGYNFNCDVFAFSSFELHTVHGIGVSDYFSTGVGLGFDMFNDFTLMPLYLNVRGYLPVSKKTRLFLNVDGGVAFDLGRNYVSLFAIYFNTSAGASFKIKQKSAFNLSFGYRAYIGPGILGAIDLRAGFQF